MGKMMVVSILAMVILPLVLDSVIAEEWIIYGPRAQGMGGAGVAVIDDSDAFYWNPAMMGRGEKIRIKISGGAAGGVEGDVISEADQVADIIAEIDWTAISNAINAGTPLPPGQVDDVLRLFAEEIPDLDQEGQGGIANGHGGISLSYENFCISGAQFVYAAGDPVIDLTRLNLTGATPSVGNIVGDPATTNYNPPASAAGVLLASQIAADFPAWAVPGTDADTAAEELVRLAEVGGVDVSNPVAAQVIYTIASQVGTGTVATQNMSGVLLKTLAVREYGFTFGYDLVSEKLGIGLTLKGMTGQTYSKFVRYDEIESGSDLVEELADEENRETSADFGVDLGAYLEPVPVLRLGVVGRNLTSPEFDLKDRRETYEVDPQVRLGVALMPLENLTIAADYDITRNETDRLDGYESQMLSAGLEYRLFGMLALRAGGYENMASDETGVVLTAGIGFHIIAVDIDIAGAYALDEVTIETGEGGKEEVPESASVTATVSIRF